MKPKSDSSDAELSGLLQEWRIEASLPPRFQEQVWRRIASEETPAGNPLAFWREWFARLFLRPSVTFSYIAILLVAGLVFGSLQARETSQRASETLSARYVRMLDPYQMPRH